MSEGLVPDKRRLSKAPTTGSLSHPSRMPSTETRCVLANCSLADACCTQLRQAKKQANRCQRADTRCPCESQRPADSDHGFKPANPETQAVRRRRRNGSSSEGR
jgi:hypothetical protein